MCRPFHSAICRLLCLLCVLCLASGQMDNCSQEPATLLCRGERAMRNALRNLSKSDKPLVIMRGLEIVPLRNETTGYGEEAPGNSETEPTLLDSVAGYLRTHEVNLRLADLLEDHSGGPVTGERNTLVINCAKSYLTGCGQVVIGLASQCMFKVVVNRKLQSYTQSAATNQKSWSRAWKMKHYFSL